jgi:hypothetical protein
LAAENNNQHLLKLLLAAHSKKQAAKIVRYVGTDAKRFDNLINIFLKGEMRLSQLASWPFSYAAIKHSEFLKPYFAILIEKLKEKNLHPAIYRNILRAFEEVEIPEEYQSDLLDSCIHFFTSEMHSIAVRAFAITVAAKISAPYPELRKELCILLSDLSRNSQAPAIHVRIRKALNACL